MLGVLFARYALDSGAGIAVAAAYAVLGISIGVAGVLVFVLGCISGAGEVVPMLVGLGVAITGLFIFLKSRR